MYPTSFGPNGVPCHTYRRSANSANPEMNKAKENKNAKNFHSSGASTGSRKNSLYRLHSSTDKRLPPGPPMPVDATTGGGPAGSRKYVAVTLRKDSPAAARTGQAYPNWDRKPEIAGPTRNPMPNAIP